jgi:hypothetical protein
MKCPVCKAPIDVLSCRNMGYNYGCASNYDHYMINLLLWEPIVTLEKETVNIYDDTHKYAITRAHINGNVQTIIDVFTTDLESRVIFSFKEKKLKLDKDVFDFKNFDVKRR